MYIPDKVQKIYKLPVEVRSAKTRLKQLKIAAKFEFRFSVT